MIRKSVQAEMTADRMSVSLDRFFLIEPVRMDQVTIQSRMGFHDNKRCADKYLSRKLPIRPRITGNLSPSTLTFP